jgi:hypothetical protein
MDAITASEDDDTIAWYENEDGVGGFGDRRLVSLSADGAWSVVAADIDGDGDLDLVSASTNDNRVVWYENQQNDCDGNSVPDECEPDCNLNGIADACDIRSGFSLDCNANGVPDPCDTGCVFACDTDHDGCHDAVDSDPRDPFKCADTDGDGCDDCSSGVFDTATDGQNSDSDGICDAGDCDPFDNEIWFPPQNIDMLTLSQPTESTVLDWRAPPEKGAVHLRYDTLRSSVASDFGAPAVCLVSDSAAPRAEDAEQPEGLFFYLVRVENDCPGFPGAMGTGSDRIPRTGLECTLAFGKCCHDGVVDNMCTVNTELKCEASGQFISWTEGGACPGGDAACDP